MSFVFWDGEECRNAGYCLFGCSVDGRQPEPMVGNAPPTYLQSPYLRTTDMLDLLLSVASANPGASHVWFNGDYDVNQILRELPWSALISLKHKGKVNWRGYLLEHIPGKIFKVSKDGVYVRIDDCFSFFRCRFDKALDKWQIGSGALRSEISEGKDKRDRFYYSDIDYIRHYWSWEVRLGCHLMEKIKSIAHGAGYKVQNWHGPGALAAYSLKNHGVTSLMNQSPAPVLSAALSAYAGGWFERFKMGRYQGHVYTYDINSAYVYAMSLLPGLASGTWRHVFIRNADQAAELAREPGSRFALFHYEWRADINGYLAACRGVPFPLFHRETDGSIRRPIRSSGWVWGPEATELSAIPYAKLTEAWIYEHDINERPFAWVSEDYERRLHLQAIGDPSEKILKWALASYYGRVAQRSGWDQKTNSAPPFHQIEWAGWITSYCRAMIYRAAMESARKDGLVSIDTDGILSTVPIPEPSEGFGNGLGQWKEEHFDEVIYLQNGVYWLRKGELWEEPKLRGIPKSRIHDPGMALRALESGEPISFARRGFTGYRQAMQGNRSEWRVWGDHPVSVNFLDCGSRVHVARLCRSCRGGVQGFGDGLHDLAPMPGKQVVSESHRLPWLEDQSGKNERFRKLLLAEEMLSNRYVQIVDMPRNIRLQSCTMVYKMHNMPRKEKPKWHALPPPKHPPPKPRRRLRCLP
jgi:hypothetical protein